MTLEILFLNLELTCNTCQCFSVIGFMFDRVRLSVMAMGRIGLDSYVGLFKKFSFSFSVAFSISFLTLSQAHFQNTLKCFVYSVAVEKIRFMRNT